MPAIGARGSQGINPQRIQAQARLPKPSAPKVFAPQHVAPRTFAPSRHSAPPPKWVGPSPVTGQTQTPFRNQRITQGRVSRRAQANVPAAIVPHLPVTDRLPTRAESAAATQLARRAQGSSRQTGREVATDPRLAAYRQALGRYLGTQELRETVAEGARQYTGSPTITQTRRTAPRGLSVASAYAIGNLTPVLQTPGSRVTAHPNPKQSGGIVPAVAHTIATIAPGLAAATKEIHPEVSLGGFGDKVTKDIKTLATSPFIGGYEAYNALWNLVQRRNPKPLEKLAAATVRGLKEGAGGQLVQGNLKGTLQQIEQHPLLGPLEVAPVVGAPGRVLGTAARLAKLGEANTAFGRAVAGVRAPLAIERESGLAQTYLHQPDASRNLAYGLAQQLLDTRRPHVIGPDAKPITVERAGRQIAVRQAKEAGRLGIGNEAERLAGRRENFRSSGLAATTRESRQKTTPGALRKDHPVKLKGKLERELVQPAGTATIRSVKTWNADVGKEIAKIKANLADPQAAGLDALGVLQNEKKLKTYEAALELPAARRDAVIKAGEANAVQHHLPADAELADAGFATHAQMRRAQLSEAGLQHVEGARYGEAVTPETVAARDAAKGAHKEARGGVKDAEKALRKAEDAHTRTVAKQQSDRMRGEQAGARPASVREQKLKAARADTVAQAKQALTEAREAEKVAAGAVPAKARTWTSLVDQNGHYIPNKRIEAELKAAGRDPNTVHYLPQRVDEQLKRSYFRNIRPSGRPGVGTQIRKGIVQDRAEHGISEALGVDELTSKRVRLAVIKAHDEVSRELGLTSPAYKEALAKAKAGEDLSRGEAKLVAAKGRLTVKEADGVTRDLRREGKGEWVAWKVTGSNMDPAQAQDLGSSLGINTMESLQHDMLKARTADDGSGQRNYVLVPKRNVDRMLAQSQPASQFRNVGQLLNGPFRMAVLPQFRWLAGNFIEPYLIRLPLAGTGLVNLPGLGLDIVSAHRILKYMDAHPDKAVKDAAQRLRALFGEGLFLGGKQATVRTRSEDLPGALGRALHLAEVPFHRIPAVKHFGQLALALPKAFFWFNRHVIENPAQMASFGKSARRELQTFTGQWHDTVLIGQKAMDEISRGLVNTATQHRFLREQHLLLGQYDGFGPGMRHAIQSWTPFLPWTLASMRFVYWTLPIHKNAQFVALMKAGQSVLPEWEQAHADTPPGTLRYGAVGKDKGIVDIARYTPYGISIPLQEEGPATLTDTFAPQAKGALNALGGQDPFGRALQLPHGAKPSVGLKTEVALNQLLEGFLPFLSTARRLQEGGGTGYSNSFAWSPKVKPGTAHQGALNRTLNPFRETYLKGKSASGPLSPHEEQHLEHLAERAAGHELSVKEEVALERKAEEAERAGR